MILISKRHIQHSGSFNSLWKSFQLPVYTKDIVQTSALSIFHSDDNGRFLEDLRVLKFFDISIVPHPLVHLHHLPVFVEVVCCALKYPCVQVKKVCQTIHSRWKNSLCKFSISPMAKTRPFLFCILV
jgi:hypothetical protein